MSSKRTARTIARSILSLALVGTLFATLQLVTGYAQETVDRRVKSRVSPEYPEIARKMGLSGVVRLQVVVAANGSVKDTKVIGGHPILVNAAVEAVKKWRFEPGPSETTEIREFKFEPGS